MNRETRSEALAVVVALWLLLGAILVLTLESCAHAPRPRAPTAIEKFLREDAAAIEVLAECDGHYYSGSGVLVGGDLALTALHVALPAGCAATPVLRVIGVGWRATATLEARWTRSDVARLRLARALRGEPPTVRRDRVPVGETLCSATATPRREHHCGALELGALSLDGGWRQRWGARAELGNSGSGVWDAEGRLVGIVTNGRFVGGEPAGVAWFAVVTPEMLR